MGGHVARKRLEADSHTIEHFHMEDIHSFYWWDSKLEVGNEHSLSMPAAAHLDACSINLQEEQEVRATIDSEARFRATPTWVDPMILTRSLSQC